MIELDGSQGEGGGQMLRTALALSAISGDAFRMKNIRAGREDPGLKAQHLAAIKAVQKLCGAVVDGAELGSTEITFYPKLLKGADVTIDIGTAGSITLVLQAAILPALFGLRISRFLISGGTDVAFAPTIDYFTEVFVPHIRTWCANIEVRVLKRGYFPVGKGVVEVIVQPKIFRDDYESFNQFMAMLQASVPKIDSTQQGHLVVINGVSHASSQGIAERQTETAQHLLAKKGRTQIRSELVKSVSEGSAMTLWAMYSLQQDEMEFTRPIRLGASALGEKDVTPEEMGKQAANALIAEMNANAPVDKHLADQLVPLIGMRGGQYRTSIISEHTKTNVEVVNKFCPEVVIDGTIIKKSEPI